MDAVVKQAAKEERSFDRLQRMGVVAWEQVLLMLPTGYNDYTHIQDSIPCDTLYPVPRACYRLTALSNPNKKGIAPPRVEFNVTDGTATAQLTAFGEAWLWDSVQKGQEIVVEAVFDIFNGYLQVKNPTLIHPSAVGRIIPIYRGKKGGGAAKSISPDFVYGKTREALAAHLDVTADYILSHFTSMDEEFLIRRSGIPYPSLRSMLIAIHAPKTMEQGLAGLAAARSLAAFEVIFNAERQMARKPNPKSVINVRQADMEMLAARFPHKMTSDQLAGVADIVNDLRRPYPMMRLLSGDVGFGKTDVALIPAIAAHLAGAKVVIMAPSLLIVHQWVNKIAEYGKNFPVQVVAGNAKIDRDLLAKNPIMVGTTALVTRLPKLKWLPDFVIFDEQQKHGRKHKESLVSANTNRLEATATCQPKTGALVHYGGMDESILNQCPVEKKIHTRIVHHGERVRLFAHLQRVLDDVAGSQIAIVYPNVSAGETKASLLSASAGWERNFPGQVGVLHGGLTDEEKLGIIDKMHSGEIRVLLSSILIETGITLPALRGLLVVGADKFGVSSLHQLRGRLARHGGVGYFYMFLHSDEMADDTLHRLELLVKHTDGFVLAEKDAEMRGYGSMQDEDASQSGVSRSAMFFGMSLMPRDIELALSRSKR